MSRASPNEIQFRPVASLVEVEVTVQDLINDPRQLPRNLPASSYVPTRTDQSDRFYILLHVAHVITDGLANAVALGDLLDFLTSPPPTHIPELEGRLAMAVASKSLHPNLALSLPRQRWRRTIAQVLSLAKKCKRSRQGRRALIV